MHRGTSFRAFACLLVQRSVTNPESYPLILEHVFPFPQVKDFETGETQGVQISGPSLTSYTDINPSFRIIYLDATTYEPIDMVTYRLDLATDGSKSHHENGKVSLNPYS